MKRKFQETFSKCNCSESEALLPSHLSVTQHNTTQHSTTPLSRTSSAMPKRTREFLEECDKCGNFHQAGRVCPHYRHERGVHPALAPLKGPDGKPKPDHRDESTWRGPATLKETEVVRMLLLLGSMMASQLLPMQIFKRSAAIVHEFCRGRTLTPHQIGRVLAKVASLVPSGTSLNMMPGEPILVSHSSRIQFDKAIFNILALYVCNVPFLMELKKRDEGEKYLLEIASDRNSGCSWAHLGYVKMRGGLSSGVSYAASVEREAFRFAAARVAAFAVLRLALPPSVLRRNGAIRHAALPAELALKIVDQLPRFADWFPLCGNHLCDRVFDMLGCELVYFSSMPAAA